MFVSVRKQKQRNNLNFQIDEKLNKPQHNIMLCIILKK